MPDPLIVAAVVTASGRFLTTILEDYLGRRASAPDTRAREVIAKTYGLLADEVTTNSLRLLQVLYQEGSVGANQLRADAERQRRKQEPNGDEIEQDVTYRMRFLQTLGLVLKVGGDYRLTQLGSAFIEEARTDVRRFKNAFK
jgi:hypothetical protein